MGDDTFDNEDEMLKMWGESMKDVNNKTALINYEDFVLLMKGQKRDRVTTRMGRPSITEGLAAVPEISSEDDDDHNAPLLAQSTPLRSFNEMEPLDTTPKNAEIVAAPARKPTLIPKNGSPDLMSAAIPSPDRKHFVRMGSNSAPATPLHYGKRFDEIDQVAESPHGMDEDGENVGGVSFNEQCAVFTVPDLDLTPPQTPVRSAADFITPTVGRPTLDPNLISGLTPPDLSLPSIMPGNISIPADLTKRGRSVSMDEKETYTSKVEAESRKSMLFKRDSRRAMAIPEHTHTVSDIDNAIKDKTKTPLVVNRKLYRAHREFRQPGQLEAHHRSRHHFWRRPWFSHRFSNPAGRTRLHHSASAVARRWSLPSRCEGRRAVLWPHSHWYWLDLCVAGHDPDGDGTAHG